MSSNKKIHECVGAQETTWISDLGNTIDRRRCLAEGKVNALRSQKKASVIRWRALGSDELFEAAAIAVELRIGHDMTESARRIARECARFGIASIEGLTLTRRRYHGVPGLDDASMTKLEMMKLDAPFSSAEEIKGLDLVEWIGGLIVEASSIARCPSTATVCTPIARCERKTLSRSSRRRGRSSDSGR